jgi:hypothetical protein
MEPHKQSIAWHTALLMHVVMGFQLRITPRHPHPSQYVPQPVTLYYGVCSSSSTIAFYQPPTPPPDSILQILTRITSFTITKP